MVEILIYNFNIVYYLSGEEIKLNQIYFYWFIVLYIHNLFGNKYYI